jgi:hypothetical protein
VLTAARFYVGRGIRGNRSDQGFRCIRGVFVASPDQGFRCIALRRSRYFRDRSVAVLGRSSWYSRGRPP